MLIFLFILIGCVFLFIKFKKSNYNITYNNITYFQGEVGSGKTTVLTHMGFKERNKRIRHNYFFYILRKLFPKVKAFRKYNVEIYSSYPIWVNKKYGFSRVVDKSILSWDFRVPEDNPIIILDEMELIFPNEAKQTDPVFKLGTAYIRHALNASIFASSQSLSEVNIEFRRRVNAVYMLNNIRYGFLNLCSCVDVRKGLCSEEFTNVYVDDPKTVDIGHTYRFKLKDGHFDSRYASNLYKLKQENIVKLSKNYDLLLKAQGLKCGDKWRSLKYVFNDKDLESK